MTRREDETIYNSQRWSERRAVYKTYKAWYDGTVLGQRMEKTDRDTGNPARKFPLEINLPKLGCDIHRDLARGIPDHDAPLIIQTTVERNSSPHATDLEDTINSVWRRSYGADIQQRGLLDMNVFGGVAYLLKWEPWNRHLPHRFAVRKIPDPGNIMPVWGRYDPWRMSECYIGFKISREEAQAKYNIVVDETVQDVLYLEYWGQKEWWVHVHGQVPTMTWGEDSWPLKGSNPFGFVPVYYIPHDRTMELFGDSDIEGQKELTRDFNSRAATLSDIMRSTCPGLFTGHDISRRKLEVKRIIKDGVTIAYYIDLGDTRNIQGAQKPELDALPGSDIPEGLIEFPDTLLHWWMMVKRISPAAFGTDDTRSGRITGPTTAQRMWTSVAHAATERINYTAGKCIIDQDIITALKVRPAALPDELRKKLDETDPASLDIKQRWPPMIPLDRQRLHQELIDELRGGGASIERYLKAKGVEDVDGEKERIMEWIKWVAETEAQAKVTE